MVMPLLEGLDGVRKMSKSYGNYVGVSDPPQEMFGKLMSVSDELMDRYYLLLLGEARDPAGHPMDAKKSLAEKLTSRYHGDASRPRRPRRLGHALLEKRPRRRRAAGDFHRRISPPISPCSASPPTPSKPPSVWKNPTAS